MTFINEYIPAEDIKKYDLENINKRFIVGGTNARDWTIDRERNMYLRNVANGREEFCNQSTWTFYWHGELLVIKIELIDCGGSRGGACWSHKKIRDLQLPQHFAVKQNDILTDLKEAFLAYKDGGVFATATDYELTLEV